MISHHIVDGKEYKSIKLPKGTILFRGLHYGETSNYKTLFADLVGTRKGSAFIIAPTMNVFFYPVPYVSDTVNIYNLHTIYVTQYDIDLLLLVKPSTLSRSNITEYTIKDELITPCDNIGKLDKCGNEMTDDPCLTEKIFKVLPQIDGYIGLDENDAALFNKKYADFVLKYKRHDLAKQILSSIITNSRGISGIPEIVIHPLRFRQEDCHIIRRRFYNIQTVIDYCIDNRAMFNFFPLLYFTDTNVFTFNQLGKLDRLKNRDQFKIPPLYENINRVFDKMLNNGYKINNKIYKVLVDIRTGFYVLEQNKKNTINRHLTHKRTQNILDYNIPNIDSYIVKPNNDPLLNTLVSIHTYPDLLLLDLNANGYGMKKRLAFDRKNKKNYVYRYYIDKVLNRPDLDKYNNLRRKRVNITQKRALNSLLFTLPDVNVDDLEDISSVESI
jgi:hypothetical protein